MPNTKKFSLVPQYSFRDITDIKADFLVKLGIKFLMLDLDNTIAAYDEHLPSDDVLQWIEDVRSCGIELFIISNTTRKNRVEAHCGQIGVRFILRACKPSPKSLLKAMEIAGAGMNVSALIGDQVFTDTLAANRAGIISISVRPRRFTNPLLKLRYYIEVPFRAMCKNKM